MAEPQKKFKIEIESANGTKTDLTPFVVGVPTFIHAELCGKCLREFPKYKYFSKQMRYLFLRFHKCRPLNPDYLKMLKSLKIEIRGPMKTRHIDWWRWN